MSSIIDQMLMAQLPGLFGEIKSEPIMGGNDMFAFQNQQAVPPSPVEPAKTLFNPSSSGRSEFEGSSLPKLLQRIGVDDKGIALSDLGRAQLIGRLQKKFGSNYSQNTDALDALSAFDDSLKKFPMTATKSSVAATDLGNKTLKFFDGMSLRDIFNK